MFSTMNNKIELRRNSHVKLLIFANRIVEVARIWQIRKFDQTFSIKID